MRFALQGVAPRELQARVPELSAAEARRVISTIYRRGPECLHGHVPQVRAVALDAMRERAWAPTLEVIERRESAVDSFKKVLFATDDGGLIEAVRIPLERADRCSVCVSSQIGCALGCVFCATGRLGLRRNLAAWEIVEQVRQLRQGLPSGVRVHGVVFQGMGEPLANIDRVLAAIRVLTDPSALAINARAITVSTAGLPAGIRRLAREAPSVRLAISIASAVPERRRRLMPIDGVHALPQVIDAAVEHAKIVRQSPMFALTLLRGINDGAADATALADLLLDFEVRTGIRARLSIIPYNEIASGSAEGSTEPFSRTSKAVEDAFRDVLAARGVFSHRRYSGGADIAAACGQLAAKSSEA